MIEESLMEVYDLIHDKSQPLSGKVEALKFAARLASMGEGAQVDTSEKIIFNISIGGSAAKIRNPAISPVIEGEVTEAVDTSGN